MTGEKAAPAPQSGIISVLRVRNYRLLWLALSAAWMSRMMWIFASSYLVFQLSGSSLLSQMVNVTFSAPQFLFGIFSGAVVDAFDRRRLYATIMLFMCLATVVMAVLAFTGIATAPAVLVVSLLVGGFFSIAMTWSTLTMDVVGQDRLSSAMALDNVAFTLAAIAGPLLAGLLLDIAPGDTLHGTAWAYVAIAALFGLSSVLLAFFVRREWVQHTSPLRFSSAAGNMAEGFKVVAASSAMIGILGVTVLLNLVSPPVRTLIPVFGETVLHAGPAALGLLGAGQGIGSLIGALFLASRKTIQRKSLFYWVGSVISTGLLAVFAAAQSYPLALAALIASGVGNAWFGTMQSTLVLLSVRPEVRGRAMGILSMAIGAQTLGSVLLGVLSDALGPEDAVLLIAITGTLSTLGWVALFKEMRKL
jgi:MFS family permease